ncbi:MAG: hypothetical protein ACLQFM_15985 [Terriglobales bacterium]
MHFHWELVYFDLDALQMVLKLTHGTRRCLAMHVFDTAHLHDWKVGDLIAIDPGNLSREREIEKQMGVQMSEDDYTLYNQRTGGKAPIRKNDWEVEGTTVWLNELIAKGLVNCETRA